MSAFLETGMPSAGARSRACEGKRAFLSAALLLLPLSNALAGEVGYPEQLEIRLFQPCAGTATFCWPRLLLRGYIDDGAATRLAAKLQEYPVSTIVFDSPGGSLSEGLKIGALIRKQGIKTELASRYEEELPELGLTTIVDGAVCMSACVYAFMGGVSRSIIEEAKVGVHQFYSSDERASESTVQVTTAVLSQYMASMGVSRELLDLASVTVASEMTLVSHADAVTFNLDNQTPALARWGVRALEDGTVVAAIDQQQPGSDMTTKVRIGSIGASSAWALLIAYGPVPEVHGDVSALVEMESDDNPQFCDSQLKCFDLIPTGVWQFDAASRTVVGVFRAEALPLIQFFDRSETFSLECNFHKSNWDVDGNATFGKDGLKSALLAIAK